MASACFDPPDDFSWDRREESNTVDQTNGEALGALMIAGIISGMMGQSCPAGQTRCARMQTRQAELRVIRRLVSCIIFPVVSWTVVKIKIDVNIANYAASAIWRVK